MAKRNRAISWLTTVNRLATWGEFQDAEGQRCEIQATACMGEPRLRLGVCDGPSFQMVMDQTQALMLASLLQAFGNRGDLPKPLKVEIKGDDLAKGRRA